jgi:hypothetical protein
MTATILATAILMGAVMTMMAVGVMFGRPELKGSCGGKEGAACVCSTFDRLRCKTRKLVGDPSHSHG